MEAADSRPNRILAAVGLLVLAGWLWALSNVGMPDALWLANVALTLVFLGLLAATMVRRARRT